MKCARSAVILKHYNQMLILLARSNLTFSISSTHSAQILTSKQQRALRVGIGPHIVHRCAGVESNSNTCI